MGFQLKTVRGYDFYECASALQKAIRRGDARLAGYFAIEMFESNFYEYLWKRLLVISAEDCFGILTQELESLYRACQAVNKGRGEDGQRKRTRVFIGKAVLLLAMAKKSRDVDHLTNLVYDGKSGMTDEAINGALDEARQHREEVPEYAFDCHTRKGKKMGKTKKDFFVEEHDALKPREKGLFDGDVASL